MRQLERVRPSVRASHLGNTLYLCHIRIRLLILTLRSSSPESRPRGSLTRRIHIVLRGQKKTKQNTQMVYIHTATQSFYTLYVCFLDTCLHQPPPGAMSVWDFFAFFLFLCVSQVLEFNHIDCPLSIGYMLAMPTRQAYDTFRRTIRYSSDDYGRYLCTPYRRYAFVLNERVVLLLLCRDMSRACRVRWHIRYTPTTTTERRKI